jgi:hypothetical protein
MDLDGPQGKIMQIDEALAKHEMGEVERKNETGVDRNRH